LTPRQFTEGFVCEVTDREDTEIFEVPRDTQDAVPGRLAERLLGYLSLPPIVE